MNRSAGGRARWGLFVRALVLVLAASLGSGGALPWFARQIAGPAAHVCHCSTHYDCLCVRCQPDRPELRFSEASIKGQCGQDEVSVVGKAFRAIVMYPAGVPVAGIELASRADAPPALRSVAPPAPPTPPPRA